MAIYYDDLPDELQRYFPSDKVAIVPTIRRLIDDGWAAMSATERARLRADVQGQRDPFRRVIMAVQAATEGLMKHGDVEELEL